MQTSNTIPKITEDKIEKHVGSKSFDKGVRYFESGAIFETRKVGMTLKASCEGSYENSYRLRVKFSSEGISEGECSCPVGGGGTCKHVAALLLTWHDEPEEFIEIPDIDEMLKEMGKSDLINLIKRMLHFDPELEMMLQTIESEKRHNADPKIYERQTDVVFRRSQTGWRGEIVVAGELSALKESGDSFTEKEELAEAAAVYEGVSTSIMNHLAMFPEEESISPLVNECVNGLSNCLERTVKDDVRLQVLKALFAIYRKDIDEFGGIGISDEVPKVLLKYCSDNERELVAEWLHTAISRNSGHSYDDWSKKEYKSFLQSLKKSDKNN